MIEDLERIFRISRLEINATQDQSTLLVSVDRRTYRLNEIGSGFSQFVILLASVAMRRPTVLLLDEPELHLHPSLQLDFLTTLASYTLSNSVVFATHSLGLARSAADRVFAFQVKDRIVSVRPFEATTGLAEFLGEMSFAGYKELGFDAVLLVEGPTEVRAIKQFLRALGRGRNVVILPLGGSSLIRAGVEHELSEILRLSTHVFALIDSEREEPGGRIAADRAAFLDVCRRLGIAAHATDYRAFENYLPDHAVKTVKGAGASALSPFERLADARVGWAKHENWRIARETNHGDLEKTDVGKFLLQLPS